MVRTNGGCLLVVGDDPGLSSSQNEQDSRFFAPFAHCALLEPSDAQEAKQYVGAALRISEEYGMPAILRLTTTLCHSQGAVELGERVEPQVRGFVPDQARYCMLPPHANRQQWFMRERTARLRDSEEAWSLASYADRGRRHALIITSGASYQYLQELALDISVLKLGLTYPLPLERIKQVTAGYDRVLVIEELSPFLEDQLKAAGIAVEGKRYFPFTGELTTDHIRAGLEEAGVADRVTIAAVPAPPLPARTPMLCAGCPHRPVFHILQKARATVIGDIGCYSLGMLEPFEVLKTNISMGASLGMVQGMATAHRAAGQARPLVAVIGDGTFFHSGLAGFADLAGTKDNITVIVLDNRTTAMTGGQATPTTRELADRETHSIDIPAVLRAFGIADVTVVDQFDYQAARSAVAEAMKREGLSVVITTRPCALHFGIREPHYYVDPDACISCRRCIEVNCPPIAMRAYAGRAKKNSSIDPHRCVGCSVCSQVCPVGAIKRYSAPKEAQS